MFKKIILTIILSLLILNQITVPALAASPNPSPSASASPVSNSGTSVGVANSGSSTAGGIDQPDPSQWKQDAEVTFTGKLAARSKDLLNWVIANHKWSYLRSGSDKNPLEQIWLTSRFIVLALLSLFILAGAFIIIISRGQSLTIRKFIPKFVLILILIWFSFSLVQYLYQVTDGIQQFFLIKNTGSTKVPISSSDLLNISFDYDSFVGFRRIDEDNFRFDESAFVSLLMLRLTAATYYIMFLILTVRKVILWFFIIISPIFPLLLFFYPIKNTAKIWLGEFFRWLLYGPLFAIFLAGIVAMWKIYIPLANQESGPSFTDINKPCGQNQAQVYEYPTSINILLGGPCQSLSYYNSLNIPESFIQYIVALLMLWMVILMPFILLKVFLDYMNNLTVTDTGLVKYLINTSKPKPQAPPPNIPKPPSFGSFPKPPPLPILPTNPPPTIAPPRLPSTPAPVGQASAGLARQLPRTVGQTRDLGVGLARGIPRFKGDFSLRQVVSEILGTNKVSAPTLRDIARFETSQITKNQTQVEEFSKISEALGRISGQSQLITPVERSQAQETMQKLQIEAQKGNPIAASVINATKSPQEAAIPEQNQVQTVNLEEYEEVKKTWLENYSKLDPPPGVDGSNQTRKEWLLADVKQIPEVINLLLSGDPIQVEKGKQMVSKILPFLLLGGFSKSEIVAYLKAKLEAAKQALEQLVKSEADEDSQLYVENKPIEQPKTMTAEASLDEDKKTAQPADTEKNNLGEKVPEKMPQSTSDDSNLGTQVLPEQPNLEEVLKDKD